MITGNSDTAGGFRKLYFLGLSKLISWLIPTKHDKWIFGSEMGYAFSSNSKYLFNFIRHEKKNVRAIWISKSRLIVKKVIQEGGEAYFNFSHKGIFHCISAGVYFCSTDPSDVMLVRKRTCKIINLWHSVTLKKVVYDKWPEKQKPSFWRKSIHSLIGRPTFPDVDLHVATSESQVKVLSSAFNSRKFIICGQPREDIMFGKNVSSIAKKVKEQLNIDNKKLVMYMPTHRDYGKGNVCPTVFRDDPEAKQLLEMRETVVYTKNHINMQNKVQPYIDPNNIIREITLLPIDTQELLCAADILITDYSSCYIEYLHLNRPVIFFHYDDYTNKDNELYFCEKDIMPGPIVKNEKELLNAVIAALNFPQEYSRARQRVRSFFYKHCDGHSTDRIFHQILNLQNMLK